MSAQNSKYGHLLDKLSSTGIGRSVCSYMASATHTHICRHTYHMNQSSLLDMATDCKFGREQRDVVSGRVATREPLVAWVGLSSSREKS